MKAEQLKAKIVDGAAAVAIEHEGKTLNFNPRVMKQFIKENFGERYVPLRRWIRGGACKIHGL